MYATNVACQLVPEDDWGAIVAGLDFAFQPIVNIHTGACYGYEALVRGGAEAGFSSIGAMFDAAHDQGVLGELEVALRSKAVEKFAAIPHHRHTKLFLNMDTRGLAHTADIGRTLERCGLDETALVLEISERHALAATAPLEALKRANLRLAIDDFGTGFAGLQMLYEVEPDFLKIDRFFVADIAEDAKKKLFLAQIVNIAHLLGMVVLAEGVETERELHVCKDIGCDLVQGYLVQRPTCDITALRLRYPEIARRERRAAAGDQELIGTQITYVDPVSLDTPMALVFERFRKSVTFLPVVDAASEPVGIVRECDLKAYAYSPFGRELIANKACGRTLKDFVTRCPIADINTKAEHILQAYSTVGDGEGIIIVEDMKYVGFLSAHSLLRVINEKNLAAARDQNPLTKLPGNNRIMDYVSDAVKATDASYVLAYFDFDNFKPFNDKYGFRLGDRAILLFAELLAKWLPPETAFAGHIGGDDFFAGFHGMAAEDAITVCLGLAETFRRDIESFYDDDTRRAGHITGQDRLGNTVRFPLMTVSAAVVELPPGRPRHTVDDVSTLIAGLKKEAKQAPDRLSVGALATP